MRKKDQELLDAARNGNITVVGKMLDHFMKRGGPFASFRRGTNINCQDMNGYTALHHACLNGHSNIVSLLLFNLEVEIDVRDIRGSTPLYLASWAGHPDIVRMLLTRPFKAANANVQTNDNETSLHCAAQHGHSAVISILLAHGANPSIRNDSFQTALDLASQFGRLQTVQILIKSHPELLEPFKLCDEAKYEVNHFHVSPTKHMFTHSCLHLASRNGHKKVVETLLAAGVYVNLMTHTGTALHEAALCGKKSVVCLLLNAGVDPTKINKSGFTALDLLKDFPPQATYEIVTIINDAIKNYEISNRTSTSLDENDNHINAISNTDYNDNEPENSSLEQLDKRDNNFAGSRKLIEVDDEFEHET